MQNLRCNGHSVATIGPLAPEPLLSKMRSWSSRRLLGKSYISVRDPSMVRTRAEQASDLLDRMPRPDAVVVMHPADAAFLRSPVPLILVHDVTWHQLLDFYPFYARERLMQETIEGGYEIDRLAFANCDHIVMSSRWAARSVVEDYGIDGAEVAVNHFGPNLDKVPGRSDLQQSIKRRGHGPCRILTVAVDWQRKGGDMAVATVAHLRASGVPAELQVVGCAAPADSPSFVRSLGFLSKRNCNQASQLERLFTEADFLLLPSRADCSPIALNEAAAFGLPVATTATGGISEIIGGGTWGVALDRHAPARDYAAWIAKMHRDRIAYEGAAWAAREAFEQRLNWNVFCGRLTDIINEIQPKSLSRAPSPSCESAERRENLSAGETE